jgi:hypothetical protein
VDSYASLEWGAGSRCGIAGLKKINNVWRFSFLGAISPNVGGFKEMFPKEVVRQMAKHTCEVKMKQWPVAI